MKYTLSIVIFFVLSSCATSKYLKNYPREVSRMINHNLSTDNDTLIVLERHEALIVNQMSLLFANSDSIFTIDKDFFHSGNAFTIDERNEDWNVIKKYLDMEFIKDTVGTDFKIYCCDCDYYVVKRIYIDHVNRTQTDTLYSGNFP